jgi:tetratricopeptide (TPR) repeat protein
MRKNRFEEAVEAGARAVQLQPDLVAGHYFLGLAYLVGAEMDAARYQNAATHLCDAIRVDPQWQPSWFVLSDLALMVGDYRHAEYYARRLIEISRTPKGVPFIGAELVLGSVRLRQGNIAEARQFLIGFLEQLAESDHMYRDAMSAAAACVLGDVELRSGERAAALAAYRRGWHTVQEYPRIMAYQRIAERAQAGLAAAYASVGERRRAEDLVDRVSRTAQDSESMAHNAAAASMSEVYWTLATAWARLGDRGRGLEMLTSAVRTGWRDATWMERDPEFASLRDDPAFRRLVGGILAWSRVQFDDRDGLRPVAG